MARTNLRLASLVFTLLLAGCAAAPADLDTYAIRFLPDSRFLLLESFAANLTPLGQPGSFGPVPLVVDLFALLGLESS